MYRNSSAYAVRGTRTRIIDLSVVYSLASLVLIAITAYSQEPKEPAFDVVSVKPYDLTSNRPGNTGFHIEEGRAYCNCALSLMLQNAYGLKPYRMIGPPWLLSFWNNTGHVPMLYQLDARFSGSATIHDVPAMMRIMLADRFHLKAHREFRNEPVYALRIAPGGLKLASSPPPAPPDPSLPPPPIFMFPSVTPGSWSMAGNSGELKVHGSFTMATLVWFLSTDMDREVVDETGATGAFDIQLDARILSRRSAPAGITQWADDDPRVVNVPSIFSEIQRLGLRLEAARAPIEHLVIDAVESIPTPN